MVFLAILSILLPFFFNAMDKPYTPSGVEETFLKRVLGLNLSYNFEFIEAQKAAYDKEETRLRKEKESTKTQLAQLEFQSTHNPNNSQIIQAHIKCLQELQNIEYEEKHYLKKQEEYELLLQEKETYEQFIRWHQRPAEVKLRDLKFLFNKMALENNVEGMQAIEALTLNWKLIANAGEKSVKLDYCGTFIDTLDNGQGNTAEYLVNKNISLKNTNSSLLAQICWGKWGSRWWGEVKETQQTDIVRAMIKKGAPSSLNDIRMYLLVAQESNAPERLIKYLKEVEISRKNSNS